MVKQQMLLRQIGAINDDELIMPQMAEPFTLGWGNTINVYISCSLLFSLFSLHQSKTR